MLDKNFKSTIDILNKNKIDYWICHGTLLGIVRDNKLIPWDNDVDIGFFENKVDKNFLLKLFVRSGFKKKNKFFKNDGLITLKRDGGKEVDLNFYNLNNDNLNVNVNWYIPKNNLMKLIHALTMPDYYDGKYKSIIKMFSLSKNIFKMIMSILVRLNLFYRKAGYHHPYSLIKEISEKEFCNLTIKIPKNFESYLDYIYGINWRIPQKNFNWLKDSPAARIYDDN